MCFSMCSSGILFCGNYHFPTQGVRRTTMAHSTPASVTTAAQKITTSLLSHPSLGDIADPERTAIYLISNLSRRGYLTDIPPASV